MTSRKGSLVERASSVGQLSAVLIGVFLGAEVARADGCFVLPFVWNKQKDINEPTQKAIILYDAGREDLILQVKYEGPVNTFGWLVPVPAVPKVQKASMQCFYELSRYTQEHMEPRRYSSSYYGGGAYGGSRGTPEPVKVIETKTVGAYRVTVLSAETAGSLQNWLKKNQFSFPKDKADVLDFYLKQQWYFVAVRIELDEGGAPGLRSPKSKGTGDADMATQRQLARGELHPLLISFKTGKCVFPLKISSVNGTASEVQVYVLSTEPLVEKSMFELRLRELGRENTANKEPIAQDMARSQELTGRARMEGEFDPPRQVAPTKGLEETLYRYNGQSGRPPAYAVITSNDLPLCAAQLPDLQTQSWWLSKQTWQFKAEEMHDLEFQPAIPIFAEKLGDEEGYFAALNLTYLGSNSVPVLRTALQSTNPAIRRRAAGMAYRVADEGFYRAVFDRWNDPDPEVRVNAAHAAGYCPEQAQLRPLLKLLRDEDEEVRKAAAYAITPRKNEATNYVPILVEMLKEQDPGLQAAVCLALSGHPRPPVPQEILVRLLKTPHFDVFNAAYLWLWRDRLYCSCDDAEPLLGNPLMAARLLGLQVLQGAGSARAVELAMPLLRDREKRVRDQAQEVLQELTAQDLPEDQPEKWEQWWVTHKADLPQATEKDLIDCLTKLAEYSYQHSLPHFLIAFPFRILPGHDRERQTAIWAKRQSDRTPAEQRDFEFWRRYRRVARYLHDSTVPDSFRYLGAGVAPGDKDHIVCCYLPKGAKMYRAVYGDLSVKEVPPESLPPLTPMERARPGQ